MVLVYVSFCGWSMVFLEKRRIVVLPFEGAFLILVMVGSFCFEPLVYRSYCYLFSNLVG